MNLMTCQIMLKCVKTHESRLLYRPRHLQPVSHFESYLRRSLTIENKDHMEITFCNKWVTDLAMRTGHNWSLSFFFFFYFCLLKIRLGANVLQLVSYVAK